MWQQPLQGFTTAIGTAIVHEDRFELFRNCLHQRGDRFDQFRDRRLVAKDRDHEAEHDAAGQAASYYRRDHRTMNDRRHLASSALRAPPHFDCPSSSRASWLARSLAASTTALNPAGVKPWFYQLDFGPAVMWTCGHDFVLPDERDSCRSAVSSGRKWTTSPARSCRRSRPCARPIGAQPWLMWSHLLRGAAVVWSFTGIAWSRLAPLAGMFYGAPSHSRSCCCAWFQAACSRDRRAVRADVAAVPDGLPQLRDFSKVPFMLGLAWLMAQLLMSSISTPRPLAVSAGYGAALGFAIGFRNDVLITIPPFILLLMLARQSAPQHAVAHARGRAVTGNRRIRGACKPGAARVCERRRREHVSCRTAGHDAADRFSARD